MAEEQNTEKVEETKAEETSKTNETTEVSEDKANKSERNGLENLRVLENIDVKLTVEVGGAEIKLRELLRINEGSVIELERLAGDPLDILANGTIIAKGEVVMIGERFGIRFTEVVDPKERVQNL
ncbi:MAG: flagellar motor switch protein FliN [Pelagibacterales bacterium]|nr:flagellar motor switch protein FliN [Pelagibacterales bacterium]OUU61176.1 MAG: flagellar motor switch protein FliN [Alphaproteobacteria bacterium TMED62]|tara:strand:+ start:2572 stop:2946 length:375 start_codon:yes stop_codon:yes gene_type:complete